MPHQSNQQSKREALASGVENELAGIHQCQDDGGGCEYENFSKDGRSYTRCRLRHEAMLDLADFILKDRATAVQEAKVEIVNLVYGCGYLNENERDALLAEFQRQKKGDGDE
jgi:hypothetical protein